MLCGLKSFFISLETVDNISKPLGSIWLQGDHGRIEGEMK
jgi:hypothetical protein